VVLRAHVAKATCGSPWRSFAAARHSSSSSLQAEQDTNVTQEAARGGLALPHKRRARPLAFTEKFLLFRSTVNIQAVADTARRRCQIGAGLAACGFSVVVVNIAQVLPLPALAMLSMGAAANTYALVVVAQRLIRKLAAQHVDRIRILPLPQGAPEETKQKLDEEEEEGGFASLLFDAATVEQRLQVTAELPLEVRSGTTDRWFSLIDAPANDEVELGRFSLGENSEVAAGRPATFADLCTLGLLRVDMDAGSCNDQAFLDALLESRKVCVDEHLKPREDAGATLAPDAAAPLKGELLLSSMTGADVQEAAKAASKTIPAEAIEKIGKRARLGGISVLIAGSLFLVGESARDEDGVPRWKNLPI